MAKKNARKNAAVVENAPVVASAETQLVTITNADADSMAQFMATITNAADEAEHNAVLMAEAEAELAEAELLEKSASDEVIDLLPTAEGWIEIPAADDEAPATDDEPASEVIKPAHVPGDLKALKSEIALEDKEEMREEIKAQFESRRNFEKAQPGLSSKMIPNLDAEEKKMASIGVAGLFLAMNVDPDFINREVSTGSRFNIYAFQKVNDLLVALDGGFMQNAINRAIVTSLFNFRDAGIPFTGAAALCAVSDKIKADRAIVKHLVRHTVSANTASTQKSSTMTALKTLGIVENSGTRGHEVWTLTDTPATRRLEEVVRKAA